MLHKSLIAIRQEATYLHATAIPKRDARGKQGRESWRFSRVMREKAARPLAALSSLLTRLGRLSQRASPSPQLGHGYIAPGRGSRPPRIDDCVIASSAGAVGRTFQGSKVLVVFESFATSSTSLPGACRVSRALGAKGASITSHSTAVVAVLVVDDDDHPLIGAVAASSLFAVHM